MQEGVDFYWENEYRVFTRNYLLNKRVKGCCKNGCRHCPWGYKKEKVMKKEDLFFDMDGVLVDFDAQVERWYKKNNGATLLSEMNIEERDAIVDSYQETPGFYETMPPMKNAIEAYTILFEEFNCYILSAPSWDNARSYMEKRIWVGNHLRELAYKRLILTHEKGMYEGRALIDDRTKYNVESFTGEHIHFGTEKFIDWDAVVAYLAPHRYNDYHALVEIVKRNL